MQIDTDVLEDYASSIVRVKIYCLLLIGSSPMVLIVNSHPKAFAQTSNTLILNSSETM